MATVIVVGSGGCEQPGARPQGPARPKVLAAREWPAPPPAPKPRTAAYQGQPAPPPSWWRARRSTPSRSSPSGPRAARRGDLRRDGGGGRAAGRSMAAAAQSRRSWQGVDEAFFHRHSLPTARFETFTDFGRRRRHWRRPTTTWSSVRTRLAAAPAAARRARRRRRGAALQAMVDKEFGAAGDECVVEELLVERECSVLAFCDGKGPPCACRARRTTSARWPATAPHRRDGTRTRAARAGGECSRRRRRRSSSAPSTRWPPRGGAVHRRALRRVHARQRARAGRARSAPRTPPDGRPWSQPRAAARRPAGGVRRDARVLRGRRLAAGAGEWRRRVGGDRLDGRRTPPPQGPRSSRSSATPPRATASPCTTRAPSGRATASSRAAAASSRAPGVGAHRSPTPSARRMARLRRSNSRAAPPAREPPTKDIAARCRWP